MEEMGTLPRDTMAKVYRRLCFRIEAMVKAADGFSLNRPIWHKYMHPEHFSKFPYKFI
jgi:hypothetical protein